MHAGAAVQSPFHRPSAHRRTASHRRSSRGPVPSPLWPAHDVVAHHHAAAAPPRHPEKLPTLTLLISLLVCTGLTALIVARGVSDVVAPTAGTDRYTWIASDHPGWHLLQARSTHLCLTALAGSVAYSHRTCDRADPAQLWRLTLTRLLQDRRWNRCVAVLPGASGRIVPTPCAGAARP